MNMEKLGQIQLPAPEDFDPHPQRQIVKDFLIKFTKIYKKGARSTVWLLTPRLIDYIFPFSRSLQRYA